MFTLEWLKQQQERSSLHWYVTGCTCENCREVRQTLTFPASLLGIEQKTQERKRKRR